MNNVWHFLSREKRNIIIFVGELDVTGFSHLYYVLAHVACYVEQFGGITNIQLVNTPRQPYKTLEAKQEGDPWLSSMSLTIPNI